MKNASTTRATPAVKHDRRRPFRRLQPRPLRHRRVVLPDHAARASWSPVPSTRRCARLRSPATTAWIVTPRGGGTSQCGQTVNDGIVVDFSKHLNRILSLDVENRTCVVEPGIVLDDLNRQLKKHGLWFPVDVSTASRATIGGMAGNNSCGGRSLRYGTMRDNTLSMDAALADGTRLHFGEVPRDLARVNSPRERAGAVSRHARSRRARGRRDIRAVSRKCSAASAATISMRWCRAMRRTTWRIFWSAPKARWPSPRRSNSSCGRSSATRCSASAISAVSTRRWTRPSIW